MFTRLDGQPLDRTAVWLHCRRLCERAGIPPRGPHQLMRHGCATLLRQQGASLHDVGGLLRHARITTTEIYAHVTDELRRETAQRLDDVFRLG
ncbi:MAG: site-specific integrase [Actinomycetota bacterium]|nr:site-specific integrase [Actinomycetota bacterium]